MVESRLQRAHRVVPASEPVALLGRAVHRVRNLLMSVRGYAELISLSPDGDPEHQRWARRIVDQVDHLEAMQARVDGALRETPEFSLHSLAMVVRSAVERSNARAGETASVPVELKIREDRLQHVDGEDLVEAIAALLDNAREATLATTDGSARSVGVDLGPDPDGEWCITVTDQGTGFSPDDRARAGEAFFTRKAGHLGLGIFLSSSLLERHDLEIDFDSSDLHRTVATIRERRRSPGGNR